MGIEAAERALHLQAGTDHGAIGVDREPLQVQGTHRGRDQLGIERQQCAAHSRRAARQPPAHGSIAGQDAESTEAGDHRIADQMTNVLHASCTNDQHRDQQSHHRHRRIVAGRILSLQVSAQPTGEAQPPQIPPHQLQSAERSEPARCETEGQIPVDTGVQVSFSLSHDLWPLGWGGG